MPMRRGFLKIIGALFAAVLLGCFAPFFGMRSEAADKSGITFSTEDTSDGQRLVISVSKSVKSLSHLAEEYPRVKQYSWIRIQNASSEVGDGEVASDSWFVEDMSYMFAGCSGLSEVSFSVENNVVMMEESFDLNMAHMFENCSGLSSLDLRPVFSVANISDTSYMFAGCSGLTQLTLVSKEAGADQKAYQTSSLRNMAHMFENCSGLSSTEVGNFNTANVYDMSYLFYCCSGLKSFVPGEVFTTPSVTNMTHMFYECTGLKELNLSRFNTARVTNMSHMFYDCQSLSALNIEGFQTGRVTNMSYMFYNCENLPRLNVTRFNTKNVTTMAYMFYNCAALQEIDTSRFVTDQVTNIAYMFYNCTNLDNVNTSQFVTINVYNMSHMFYNCYKLKAIDLSNVKTDNVTDMSHMFYYCIGVSELDVSGFDTEKCTDMSEMFAYCSGVDYLDISNFKTKNVRNMSGMFRGCTNLNRKIPGRYLRPLNFDRWDTTKVNNIERMFHGCSGMEDLDLHNFDLRNTSVITDFLPGHRLREIRTPRNLKHYYYLPATYYDGDDPDKKEYDRLPTDIDKSYRLLLKTGVTGIRLETCQLKLVQGGTRTIGYTISPSDASITDLIWSSGDEKVAKVDATGKVTAVGPGTTTIRVTTKDGGYTDYCHLTVGNGDASPYGITIVDKRANRMDSNRMRASATGLRGDRYLIFRDSGGVSLKNRILTGKIRYKCLSIVRLQMAEDPEGENPDNVFGTCTVTMPCYPCMDPSKGTVRVYIERNGNLEMLGDVSTYKDTDGTWLMRFTTDYLSDLAVLFVENSSVSVGKPNVTQVMHYTGRKALKVFWTQVSGASGYQLQYSRKSSYSSFVSKRVKSGSTTSLKLSGLTKNQTYYIRLRAYKTVSGKTYYSGWRKIKVKA